MGVIPVGSFEFFGKAGLASWNADITAGSFSDSDSGTDMAYGAGTMYTFGKFDLRLEYEAFNISDADKVNMVSFGFDFRF